MHIKLEKKEPEIVEKKKDRNIEIAEGIASAVAEAGGRVYYVGGFVRDRLTGIENKDVDIEVHGVPFRTLESILSRFGEQKVMGASFGIFGLKHCDLDIAMPRSEKATGRGHKDFEVSVDPFIGPEKAALRRDFTINAMMQDVLTGEILDFYGGQEDLKAGLIRHVNDSTFVEDPLRVLRAAQFAARFEFRIADGTRELCRKMDLSALSRERIMGELEKALLKARKPSVFFGELKEIGQLDYWFPELTLHSPAQQAQILDCAASLRAQAKEPLWFMLSALCLHMDGTDMPEPVQCLKNSSAHSTEKPDYGKDSNIEDIPDDGRKSTAAERFLDRLSSEVRQREYVLNMVALHSEPVRLLQRNDGTNTNEIDFMRLYDASVCPEDLLLLHDVEICAAPDSRNGLYRPYASAVQTCTRTALLTDAAADVPEESAVRKKQSELQKMLRLYHERMNSPCVMGRDLIAAGIKPGTAFKSALQYAHGLQLAGVPKEQALARTLEKLHCQPAL